MNLSLQDKPRSNQMADSWFLTAVISHFYSAVYLRKCVREILAKYADVTVLEKFMTKLGNAYEDLFRFVLDPRIPSTNNAAERGLREIVVHRKIRGSIRSKGTMRWLGNLFSCVATWQQRGIDHLSEIARYV